MQTAMASGSPDAQWKKIKDIAGLPGGPAFRLKGLFLLKMKI